MNEKSIIMVSLYSPKRIFRKICMVISRLSLVKPSLRVRMLQWGGVKIKKNCFVGSNVYFDGIFPNLIEVGENCIITTGSHILSHFINTTDRKFYSGKVTIGNNEFLGLNP